jgi:3-deoxy-manno-octulosonate cytidylyltransferase (CMP-KDO synthetase)
MSQDFFIIIPARYSSSRFPGKPLVDINGRSMLERVWEKCIEAAPRERVIVATDDERIETHCKERDINFINTPSECITGTDRVAEVSKVFPADFYINVQGDEPLINPSDIQLIINNYIQSPGRCLCGMSTILNQEDFLNLNIPKVITDTSDRLLYISRAPIPANKTGAFVSAKKQVCIYAFSPEALQEFGVGSTKEWNESIEDIEILRLIERGYDIGMIEVSGSSVAVDTPDDLKKVKEYLNGL